MEVKFAWFFCQKRLAIVLVGKVFSLGAVAGNASRRRTASNCSHLQQVRIVRRDEHDHVAARIVVRITAKHRDSRRLPDPVRIRF